MELPPYPKIQQIDRYMWHTLEDWQFWDRNGNKWVVPKGYLYNLLSIPILLRPFVTPDRDSRAALPHDWWYESHPGTREHGDLILYDYLYHGGNVRKTTAKVMYKGCRVFGGLYW